VKAAFRDAQKLRQVTKGKRASEAKQEAPFDNPERDSKKKKKSEENSDRLLRRKWWGKFCLVSVDTY
jgi:hypothetical protein